MGDVLLIRCDHCWRMPCPEDGFCPEGIAALLGAARRKTPEQIVAEIMERVDELLKVDKPDGTVTL